MELVNMLQAAQTAEQEPDHSGLGHPDMHIFDTVRKLLIKTGLSPEPATYELFYLHFAHLDPGLSTEIARALEEGGITPTIVNRLRALYLGEIAASEAIGVLTVVKDLAIHLQHELAEGHEALGEYEQSTIEQDARLQQSESREVLLQVIENIQRTNSRMMAATRRLRAEVRSAQMENAALLERLEVVERRGRTDPLTGLLNRRGLLDTLRQQIAAAGNGELSIGLVDLDDFEKVNEQWGPIVGDEVLRCVAQQVSGYVASQADAGKAAVGRYGGEKFLVVLPGMTLAEASRLLDAARAALARKVIRRATDGMMLGRLTFSAGVACWRHNDNELSLVHRADAALYSAKRNGRDRVIAERCKKT